MLGSFFADEANGDANGKAQADTARRKEFGPMIKQLLRSHTLMGILCV